MKTIITAAILAIAPLSAFAMGCSGHDATAAVTCAEGTVFDAQSGTCVTEMIS